MNQKEFEIKTVAGVSILGISKKSVLDSALLNGVVFEYSCKNGQCGVCKTTLIEGEVEELQAQLALTDEEKTNHKILTCCCEPVSDILIDAEDLTPLKGIEVKTLPARVSELNMLAENIVEVVLRFPPTANFKFLEGQYLDVLWNNIRRSYSIASTSVDKEVRLLIKKFELGRMSEYWFNQAKVNDLLRVEGPKGTFFLRNLASPLLFLATGTGIAPIISILKSLDESEEYLQKEEIFLFWGNRYPEEFVWKLAFKNIKVTVVRVVSRPNDQWGNDVGYIQNVVLSQLGDKIERFDVYACGSNQMILSARQLFLGLGLKEKQFYSDAFVQSY